jgi:hypothetical protein
MTRFHDPDRPESDFRLPITPRWKRLAILWAVVAGVGLLFLILKFAHGIGALRPCFWPRRWQICQTTIARRWYCTTARTGHYPTSPLISVAARPPSPDFSSAV